MTGRLTDHAAAFHGGAITYLETDESNADAIREVGVSAFSLRFQ